MYDFSDREYQCLGQWEEDGLLYTYTKRRDVPDVYECFVGGSSMSEVEYKDQRSSSKKRSETSGGKISIIESGYNCRRGLLVNTFGMPLTKRSK